MRSRACARVYTETLIIIIIINTPTGLQESPPVYFFFLYIFLSSHSVRRTKYVNKEGKTPVGSLQSGRTVVDNDNNACLPVLVASPQKSMIRITITTSTI